MAERRSPKPQVGGSIPSWPASCSGKRDEKDCRAVQYTEDISGRGKNRAQEMHLADAARAHGFDDGCGDLCVDYRSLCRAERYGVDVPATEVSSVG